MLSSVPGNCHNRLGLHKCAFLKLNGACTKIKNLMDVMCRGVCYCEQSKILKYWSDYSSMQALSQGLYYAHTTRFCVVKENIKPEVLKVQTRLAMSVH